MSRQIKCANVAFSVRNTNRHYLSNSIWLLYLWKLLEIVWEEKRMWRHFIRNSISPGWQRTRLVMIVCCALSSPGTGRALACHTKMGPPGWQIWKKLKIRKTLILVTVRESQKHRRRWDSLHCRPEQEQVKNFLTAVLFSWCFQTGSLCCLPLLCGILTQRFRCNVWLPTYQPHVGIWTSVLSMRNQERPDLPQ